MVIVKESDRKILIVSLFQLIKDPGVLMISLSILALLHPNELDRILQWLNQQNNKAVSQNHQHKLQMHNWKRQTS